MKRMLIGLSLAGTLLGAAPFLCTQTTPDFKGGAIVIINPATFLMLR